jgi:hypothetical protein
MEQGTNRRFVVTSSREDGPREIYDWYVGRGEVENRIKDFKLHLIRRTIRAAGASSANQFRLLLHAAAYWLLDTLRSKLVDAEIERMQLDNASGMRS